MLACRIRNRRADNGRIRPGTLPEVDVVIVQIENNGTKVEFEWAQDISCQGSAVKLKRFDIPRIFQCGYTVEVDATFRVVTR